MSNAAALPAQQAAVPAKGKSKLIVILVVVLAVLAVGGGGAFWFFHQKASADAKAEGDDVKPTKKAGTSKPPVFSTLDNFTVNLAGGDHFLQLGVVLQLRDEETAEKVKGFLPVIRNRILLLLSGKTAEELESPKGKQALIDEVLKSAREPLRDDGDNVQAVLLGSMLIQ